MEYAHQTNTVPSDNSPIFLFNWLVMVINADSRGFLIGERRLKEMSEGVNQTENNTKQILKVMTDSFQDMQKELSKSSNIRDAFSRQNRSGKAQDASGLPNTVHSTRIAIDATEKAVEATEQALAASKRIRKKAIDAEVGLDSAPSRSSGVSSTSKRAARERDSRGRFIGANGESEKKRIKSIFGLGGANLGSADVGGIDPTVDAIKELNEAVTPVKNIFKGMSAKAIGLFRGRVKKRRGDEVLSEEQREANRDSANSDRRQNKLLQSILSAIRGQGGGGLGGLGRLFGRGGGLLTLLKGGGKALLKRIPLLGALFGGGLLAKNWGSLSSGGKGKGIGQIIGTVVGGALGSFLGLGGTIAGGTLGNYLGGIFGEKIGTWTDSLKKIDFGAIFKDFLKDKLGIGNGSGKQAFIPYANAGQGKMERFKNWASDKLGVGGSTETVGDKIDYSGAAGNVNSAGNVATDRNARKLGMYNAFRKQKLTHEQALAYIGQVGRENDFGDKLFGTHTDSAARGGKSIQNIGAMSWNGPRYEPFAKFMRERGLMDKNGIMPRTQATLDAQAAYAVREGAQPQYKNRMPTFNNSPHADPKKMASDMQVHFGWARYQDYLKDKNGNYTTPFDRHGAEARGNGHIDSAIPLIEQQSKSLQKKSIPVAKGKPQDAVLFPKGVTRPTPVKVPAITPDLIKIGSKNKTQAMSSAPSDIGIGQTVSDRGLAHVMSGGIGYHQNNA